MNYNHLFYFYTTARMGGVSKAAKILRISQPSLSMQLKTFETQVGHKLFQKAGRGVQLTLSGERAFRFSQKIFEAVSDFEAYLKGSQVQPSKIKIGVSAQIETPFVADLLSGLYLKNKSLNAGVLITAGTQNQLLEQLRSKQIDLLLTNTVVYNSEFEIQADINLPVGLFIAKNKFKEMFGTGSKKMNIKQIFSKPELHLILPSVRQRLRHEIDIFLQHYSVNSTGLLESDILSVVARSIVDGLGIGFLPVSYVAEELKLKLLRPLLPEEKFWNHKFYVISRRGEKLDFLLMELIKTVSVLDKNPYFVENKKLKRP